MESNIEWFLSLVEKFENSQLGIFSINTYLVETADNSILFWLLAEGYSCLIGYFNWFNLNSLIK